MMNVTKFPLRFFIITFLWSWFCWLAPSLLGKTGIPEISAIMSKIGPPLGMVAAFGPVIGAIISLRTLEGKGAVSKLFKTLLSLNFSLKVWASIFGVIGGCAFLAWFIPEIFGASRPPRYLPNLYIFPLFFLFMTILGGGQEEIGWRGYILPHFEKRFGLITGPLLLGIIWSIWHVPLWFIPGSNQTYMNFFAFMLGCIGLSYFLSWIMEASGKRLWSVVIAHGAVNSFMALFPSILMVSGIVQTRFWLSQILLFIAGIIIVMVRTFRKSGKQHI